MKGSEHQESAPPPWAALDLHDVGEIEPRFSPDFLGVVDEKFDDIDQLTGAQCPKPLFDPDAPIGSDYPLGADARRYLDGVTEIANELLGFILEALVTATLRLAKDSRSIAPS